MENEFYRDYKERVMPALQKQHGYKNVHQVPKVEKVVINTSVGSQSDVKQALEEAKMELALLTGQQAIETRAKKSISNFKLRKDQAIFPEVELDKIKRNIGFDVTIVTTARTNDEAKSLLGEMGMPFSDRARKPPALPTT